MTTQETSTPPFQITDEAAAEILELSEGDKESPETLILGRFSRRTKAMPKPDESLLREK